MIKVKGRIHSVESMGTVDGPGVRFIVFTQGCPLRCLYCHNPDTWDRFDGKEMEVSELIDEIKQYIPYMKASGGGVTVSGGEPLLQPDFLIELFREVKKLGVNTALDTAGSVIPQNIDEVLEYTDLVLLDVKHIDSASHKDLTGHSNQNTLKFSRILEEKSIPIWVRHVLVPGYTDGEGDLKRLGQYLHSLSNLKQIDILPYHRMGEYKWGALGKTYELVDVIPPNQEAVDRAYEIISSSK